MTFEKKKKKKDSKSSLLMNWGDFNNFINFLFNRYIYNAWIWEEAKKVELPIWNAWN